MNDRPQVGGSHQGRRPTWRFELGGFNTAPEIQLGRRATDAVRDAIPADDAGAMKSRSPWMAAD